MFRAEVGLAVVASAQGRFGYKTGLSIVHENIA